MEAEAELNFKTRLTKPPSENGLIYNSSPSVFLSRLSFIPLFWPWTMERFSHFYKLCYASTILCVGPAPMHYASELLLVSGLAQQTLSLPSPLSLSIYLPSSLSLSHSPLFLFLSPLLSFSFSILIWVIWGFGDFNSKIFLTF